MSSPRPPDTRDAADGSAYGLAAAALSPPAEGTSDTPTLAHNVVHFVRVLRGAGLPMSPAQGVDAVCAYCEMAGLFRCQHWA